MLHTSGQMVKRAPQQRAPHPAPWRSREAANRREPDRKEKGRWSVQPSPRKPAPSRDRAPQPIRWSARYRTADHEPRIAALFDLVPRERLFRLHEVLHLALQLELLRRRRRRWWWFVRRDPHVPVVLEPGPGRDQPAHRDVLLHAAQ